MTECGQVLLSHCVVALRISAPVLPSRVRAQSHRRPRSPDSLSRRFTFPAAARPVSLRTSRRSAAARGGQCTIYNRGARDMDFWRAGDDRTARGSTYAAYILDKMRQDKMLTVISTGQLPERADQRTVCCTVRAVCGAWSSGASLHPGPQAGPAQPNDCGACDVRQIRRRAPRNEGCRRWHTC